MYREKYAQKQAIHLYTTGHSRPQVLEMLLQEGATSAEAEQLAARYFTMYQLLQREDAREQLRTAGMLCTIGGVFVGGGVVLSLMSMVYLHGHAVLYYGLTGLGIGLLVKGIQDRKAAQQALL